MVNSITEIKTTLSGERKKFECELLSLSDGEAVVIYRLPNDVQLEDVLLKKDTISIGYFWEEKSFNAYHWIDDQHNSLALYFNICDQTRISDSQIEWRDLVVDVLMTPDGRCRVLDEEELPINLDHQLRRYIELTREELCKNSSALQDELQDSTRAFMAHIADSIQATTQ